MRSFFFCFNALSVLFSRRTATFAANRSWRESLLKTFLTRSVPQLFCRGAFRRNHAIRRCRRSSKGGRRKSSAPPRFIDEFNQYARRPLATVSKFKRRPSGSPAAIARRQREKLNGQHLGERLKRDERWQGARLIFKASATATGGALPGRQRRHTRHGERQDSRRAQSAINQALGEQRKPRLVSARRGAPESIGGGAFHKSRPVIAAVPGENYPARRRVTSLASRHRFP